MAAGTHKIHTKIPQHLSSSCPNNRAIIHVAHGICWVLLL